MKSFLLTICLLFIQNLLAQKSTLADILWEEAGGRIDLNKNHGGAYEITDDAANGYLKVAFTEEGCGCYYETTVAAFKDAKGKYTTLKTYWDGCGNQKSFNSNQSLASILPENLGLHTFWPEAESDRDNDYQMLLYLEVSIPKKGADTQIDIEYVPYGIRAKSEDRILSFSGYGQSNTNSNFGYHSQLRETILEFTDKNTFTYVVNSDQNKINAVDKQSISKLYGSEKTIKDFENLSALFQTLNNYYSVSKYITCKSIIMGWDREKARFYIKEKIKNDAPEQSFLEFLQQLPFLMAVC